jgi:predicted ATPase
MEQQSLDPRSILLALAAMSKFESAPGANRINYFELIQQRYAQVCAPRTLVGVQIDKTGAADVYFSDGNYEYSYDGLSSGEQMWLLFLIRMVSEQTHQSIVLVDEIELHQHPIWQRRLLHLLPKIGEGNQIIATSHSEYIQEVMPRGAVIHLGALVESPQPVRG